MSSMADLPDDMYLAIYSLQQFPKKYDTVTHAGNRVYEVVSG
jgi:hypothetical protein